MGIPWKRLGSWLVKLVGRSAAGEIAKGLSPKQPRARKLTPR